MDNKINIPTAGICGHIGVGHAHSHLGFIQDDSAGFSVVATLLKDTYPANTKIKSVNVDLEKAIISVFTYDNGHGEVFVPSGMTPWEKKIIETIKDEDGIFSQRIVLESFGRIYGQGAMEVAASLQGAIALSVLDTFYKKYPKNFLIEDEDIPGNNGKILGTYIEIDGITLSVLLTINSTVGGLGPVEDMEGNISLGNKGKLMKKLNLEKLPTIIVESKNYSPQGCDHLEENTFLIRGNNEFDNITVAKSLVKASEDLNMPYDYNFKAFPRDTNILFENSQSLANEIIKLGEKFKKAETSRGKVEVIWKLNKLSREDAGGVTFMSNDLNESVGGAGALKGTSAILSLLVTPKYIKYEKIPYMTEKDVDDYLKIIKKAVEILSNDIDNAVYELEGKWDFKEEKFEYLFEDNMEV